MDAEELIGQKPDFPMELTFAKEAIMRAVSAALGGAELQDITILQQQEIEVSEEGHPCIATKVRYLLKTGGTGYAEFTVFVTAKEDGIVFNIGGCMPTSDDLSS